MKYLPLKNQPNVSRTRFPSSSPSMMLDGRGFPHISWLEEKNGRNEVKYSFWDGLKWSYLSKSQVYTSEEDVKPSPNSIILDSNENPHIVFSRRLGTGSRLSVAEHDDEWVFDTLDVTYSIGWDGIVQKRTSSDSSSSSSSESGGGNYYYVVVYDITNSEFKVYSVGDSWSLVGSISETTSSYSTIKIAVCDFKIGIAFIDEGSSVKYNFFDMYDHTWSFVSFATLSESTLYGDIIDVDIEGYDTSGIEELCVSWLSGTDYYSYVNSAICLSDGSVSPTDSTSYNIEINSVNVDSSSSDYLVNGYKRIGVTLNGSGLPIIVCVGVSCKSFSLSALNVWSTELIDIEAVGNGNVFTYVDIGYSTDVKISFVADSGDIYYFEPSSEASFPVASPDLVVLSADDYAYRMTSFNPPEGEDVSDLYNNFYGRVLRDAKKPLIISSNR